MLWGIQPVEAQATYGIAVERLRRQIHTGLLLPDEKLPAERQLSEGFGISRVTLREALRVLEADRYITVRRGAQGGAFVTDEDRLSDLARRRIAREPGNAMRIVEFLCANESAALAHVLERRGMPELKRLRQAVEMMNGAAPANRKQAEALFHLALGEASHNPLFARAIADALAELFLPVGAALQAGDPEDYRLLLAAIDSRSAAEAQDALTRIHASLWALLRRLARSAA